MPSAAEILGKLFHPAEAQADAEVQRARAAEKQARATAGKERKAEGKNEAWLRKSGVKQELKEVRKLLKQEYPEGDFEIVKPGPGAVGLFWGKGEDGSYKFGVSIKAHAETASWGKPKHQLYIAGVGLDEFEHHPALWETGHKREYLSKLIENTVLAELDRA